MEMEAEDGGDQGLPRGWPLFQLNIQVRSTLLFDGSHVFCAKNCFL